MKIVRFKSIQKEITMSVKRKRFLSTALVLVALVSIAAAAVSHRLSLVRDAKAEARASVTSQPAQVTPASRQKEILGYEVVTLTRFGFEPAEITHHGRRFFLAIENRSGLRDLTLRIDPEHGNRILEVNQPDDQLSWVDEMSLPPGEYIISTPNRAGSVCRLTIQP